MNRLGNARRYLECVLREAAAAHSLRQNQATLPEETYKTPELVRQYLRKEGLLELKEEQALCQVYGPLSNVGSHTYIAQEGQARLLRQLALVLAQFVLLRYQGYLNTNGCGYFSTTCQRPVG